MEKATRKHLAEAAEKAARIPLHSVLKGKNPSEFGRIRIPAYDGRLNGKVRNLEEKNRQATPNARMARE